jgi:hypothetical protein
MLRILKFVSFVVIRLVIAIIGTAILDTSLRRSFATQFHSVSAIIWTECLLSIVCAIGLGFSVWRIWRNSAAKYTWIPASGWFAIGFVATMGRNDVLGRLFPFGSGTGFGPAEIRSFFVFTVHLIRAICYSLGAYISALFCAAPTPSRSWERDDLR